jgi:hypothetical protein
MPVLWSHGHPATPRGFFEHGNSRNKQRVINPFYISPIGWHGSLIRKTADPAATNSAFGSITVVGMVKN